MMSSFIMQTMKRKDRIKHEVCQEYGYRSWSHARTEAGKSDISSILHETIDKLTTEQESNAR